MGKLQEIALTAVAATIDFTAIPATYKHLVVTLTARADGAYPDTDIYLTFNGDTGANYDDQYLSSTGTTGGNSSTLAGAHIRAGLTAGANAPAGVYAETTIDVLNYANTTPRKTVSAKTYDHGSDTGAGFMIEEAGQWRSTAAITRLTLTPGSGNFAAGTVATLYGVDSQTPPSAGGALTTVTAALTADVALTAAQTWYDGPTLALGAGTWFVSGMVSGSIQSGANNFKARIWDGTTAYASSDVTQQGTWAVNLSMSTLITLAAATTLRLSASGNNGGNTMHAAIPDQPQGNNATQITAIKVG